MNFYKLPDFSFWQDDPTTAQPINFEALRQKSRAVILRAGQNTWQDKTFKTNYANAKAAGVLRGSYYFYDSRADPKRQAETWARALGNDLGEMEHFADFEDSYGGAWHGWRHWYDFMENMKTLVPGIKLGVYTGWWYWRENTIGKAIPQASLNYFKQYPLWLAWYNPSIPPVPEPWDKWTLWQYTDDYPAEGWGVESEEIDMNNFNGTEVEFMARYGVLNYPNRMTARFGDVVAEYEEKQ